LGGGEIEKDNGRDNSTTIESTNYYRRISYINRRMEHNVAKYARYTPSIEPYKPQESIVFRNKLIY
jgi:hypothetical protein